MAALFTEDECANIINELLPISSWECLSVLKDPSNKKLELHDLYYQLLCTISPGIPSSLDQLAEVPLLDIHSSWQSPSGQVPPVMRLFNFLRSIFSPINPDIDFTASDLLRPKRSRTLTIVSNLVNFILFANNCKTEEDDKRAKVDVLREKLKEIRKNLSNGEDISDGNKRRMDQVHNELISLTKANDELFNSNTDLVHTFLEKQATENELIEEAEQLDGIVRDAAVYIEEQLSLKRADLESQRYDPELPVKIAAVKAEVEVMEETSGQKKSVRQKKAARVQTCNSLEEKMTELDSNLVVARELGTDKQDLYTRLLSHRKLKQTLEAELSEIGARKDFLAEQEEQSQKKANIFRVKQNKMDDLKNERLREGRQRMAELVEKTEMLGLQHTTWMTLFNEKESLTKRLRESETKDEAFTTLLGELDSYLEVCKNPFEELFVTYAIHSKSTAMLNQIMKGSFAGIAKALQDIPDMISLKILKPYADQAHFDRRPLDRVCNLAQLFSAKFKLIEETYKLGQVSETASIRTIVSQLLAEVQLERTILDEATFAALSLPLSQLLTRLETIGEVQLPDTPLIELPTVQLGHFETELEEDTILKFLTEVPDHLKKLQKELAFNKFSIRWLKAVVDAFDSFLLYGKDKHGLSHDKALWGCALELCLAEMDKRDEALKREYHEKRRKLAEKRAEEKRIEEERLAEERRIEEERLAEERRIEEERLAEEKRIEEERLAEAKRIEEERLAEEERMEVERLAEEKRLKEERLAEEKRKADEILAEEQRKEEERLGEVKREEEEMKLEEERKKLEEERKRSEEERKLEELRLAEEKRMECVEELVEQSLEDEMAEAADDGSSQKRLIRRETYCVNPPSKFRRVSEDGVKTPGSGSGVSSRTFNKGRIDRTFTKESPPVEVELQSSTVSTRTSTDSRDSEISFTPKESTLVVGKSCRAAAVKARPPIFMTPTHGIKNSTRRSSLAFTPELLKSAKRPSAIRPMSPMDRKLIERLSRTYSNVVDDKTPRRRSRSGRSISSPFVGSVTPQRDFTRKACPVTPQMERVDETIVSEDCPWDTTRSPLNFNSKACLTLDFSAGSLAEKSESYFTPCVPRMKFARAYVTPGQTELDYGESTPTVSPALTPALTPNPTPAKAAATSIIAVHPADDISLFGSVTRVFNNTLCPDDVSSGEEGDGAADGDQAGDGEVTLKALDVLVKDGDAGESTLSKEPEHQQTDVSPLEHHQTDVSPSEFQEKGVSPLKLAQSEKVLVDSETQVSRIEVETQTTFIELRSSAPYQKGDAAEEKLEKISPHSEEGPSQANAMSQEDKVPSHEDAMSQEDSMSQEDQAPSQDDAMSQEDQAPSQDDAMSQEDQAPSQDDAMSQEDQAHSHSQEDAMSQDDQAPSQEDAMSQEDGVPPQEDELPAEGDAMPHEDPYKEDGLALKSETSSQEVKMAQTVVSPETATPQVESAGPSEESSGPCEASAVLEKFIAPSAKAKTSPVLKPVTIDDTLVIEKTVAGPSAKAKTRPDLKPATVDDTQVLEKTVAGPSAKAKIRPDLKPATVDDTQVMERTVAGPGQYGIRTYGPNWAVLRMSRDVFEVKLTLERYVKKN